jgi:hypothetical protein
MTLLTDDLRAALAANAAAAAQRDHDPVPLVKLFSPIGPATWLATELHPDGTLFGLADLGFGCPELGYFCLDEIEAVRLPFGLAIERDRSFSTIHPLSDWAATARALGSVQVAEAWLRSRAHPLPPRNRGG